MFVHENTTGTCDEIGKLYGGITLEFCIELCLDMDECLACIPDVIQACVGCQVSPQCQKPFASLTDQFNSQDCYTFMQT
ncbi:hypothetical protein MAR_034218, partial [Mya arenaria]